VSNSKSNKESETHLQTGKYRHYKGNEYQVIELATHSETLEKLVVYRPLYGEQKLWVRPFDMFFETILIDGVETKRFDYIGE